MPELDVAGTFGFNNFSMGGWGLWSKIFLILGISVIVLCLVGWLVWVYVRRKVYNKRIHTFGLIGNKPTRTGLNKAKSIPVGRAGDQLWYVAGVKKYLPPGTIQSAPNEFWYWIREDGEWINFGLSDLDEIMKKAGAKYIDQDMRMQRLATDRLLEQRLMQKSFWDKFGDKIALLVFFIIIAVSLLIFMSQYGKIIDKTDAVLDKAIRYDQGSGGGTTGELVPNALLFLIPIHWLRRKRENDHIRTFT